MLRRRVISAVELTEATLERIEATDAVVQAYVLVSPSARGDRRTGRPRTGPGALAGSAPRHPARGQRYLLHAGSPERGWVTGPGRLRARYDATVVRRLEDAGAVIVGKTVTHEFAYGVNTPPTCTPWNKECYPGGSSAGSGVAVTVGSAFAPLGPIPAVQSGFRRRSTGLSASSRPTAGSAATASSRSGRPSIMSGPLTRTVEDCAIVCRRSPALTAPMEAASTCRFPTIGPLSPRGSRVS